MQAASFRNLTRSRRSGDRGQGSCGIGTVLPIYQLTDLKVVIEWSWHGLGGCKLHWTPHLYQHIVLHDGLGDVEVQDSQYLAKVF